MDWAAFNDHMDPVVQTGILRKLKGFYPDVYAEWQEENKEVLNRDNYTR